MYKKLLTLVLAGLILAAAVLTGCSSSTGTENSSDGNRLYGQVTAVDGNNITIALANSGGMRNGQQGQGGQGQRPQRSGGTRPSGDRQPQASGDAAPSGGRGFNLDLTGESKTFKITDSTAITAGGFRQDSSPATASITDIEIGSVLTVELSGENAVSITIMQFGNGNRNKGDASPDASSSPDISASAEASPSASTEASAS